MSPMIQSPPAILLLGPTGSGKTPLGHWLEANGAWGHRCHHFDFGAELRRVAAAGAGDTGLSGTDVTFVRDVLTRGLLLENENFRIAEAILLRFVRSCSTAGEAWVILNGLPRHVGQATALAPLVAVRMVVCLACGPDVVAERIRRNAGGDRGDRVDDSVDLVERKVGIFRERTAPLLAYYRAQGVRVVDVKVETRTGPADLWQQVMDSVGDAEGL